MYIAGRAALDEADALEVELELKWGRDRLRLLVSTELREKFDRQRYLTSQARWNGGLEDVKREAGRMVKAWRALDSAAEAAGAEVLDPAIWEVSLPDGTVATLVREPQLMNRIAAEGRRINVYTLAEIAQMIAAFPELIEAKKHFPGATITPTKTEVRDPLETPMGGEKSEGIFDATPPIDGIEGFNWETGDDIPF
ncbi:MAG: hypothetical protein EB015_19345 [Methylocystaceae bacterium]|nr:hypothetical protein [Methylocystaceae bacterium]